MKEPRASFVIPAFNAHAYLAQAVASCQTQSVKEIEIIVVDDGSIDGTDELMEQLCNNDPRIKYAKFDQNRGRSAARNFGNAMAQAPIILVLDSDDISLRNRVRDTLLAFQMKNPDVVYGPYQVIDENDNILGNQNAGDFNKELSLKHKMNFIGHSTMAYRKGVTLNVSYDEGEFSDLGLDDWKFQWDCILKGYKFGVTKVSLSKYRIYQLPNRLHGSPTEFNRDPEQVEKLKNEYIARISDTLTAKT
jgi:glycosyltransferase involved in cell wall biosynthesis